jgi:hypothetical protein
VSKHNESNACTSNLVSIFGPGSGPTAEATARYVSEHTRIRAVTSLGRDSTEMSGRKNGVLDSKVAELMTSLYNDARCGRAAPEYNLEKAGMIEMIFGHVAGRMRGCDNFWDDTRWTLTERGRRTSMAKLQRIILCDPPFELAQWDAKDEADDIADDCGACEPEAQTSQPPRWISPWGCLLQDSSDLGRGANEGISANAMHHISAAMIAGYQNNIGMTDLLCQKTPTADQSSRRSRRGDQN